MEFRRYLNRKLDLLAGQLNTSQILQAPFNQYQAFIEPLAAWLLSHGVNLLTETFVRCIGFAPLPGRITVDRVDYEHRGTASSAAIAPEDIVLVTTGSQVADLSLGSMTEAPTPRDTRRSWALWKHMAKEHKGFGNPDVFFAADRIADSRWVTFTITTTGTEISDRITTLTRSKPGAGMFLILKDSSWGMSLSISHGPEIRDQPQGTSIVRGYGLYPERSGTFVMKSMDRCTGEEILRELLQLLRIENVETAMEASICVPCNMPYVNNTWLTRKHGDRPAVVPERSTNLGLIGQYVEVSQEVGSASSTLPAPRGRRFTRCSSAVPRHRPCTRIRR
jgi:oleate hydratase